MPRIKILILATVAILAVVSVATAAPIPLSATGTAKTITISSHPEAIGYSGVSGTGGRFVGSIVSGGLTYADVYFWCVDMENSVSVPTTYNGNVIALNNWNSTTRNYVEKANVTGPGWNWGGSTMSGLQRYQAAAYLLDMALAGGGMNTEYQGAIWSLLDIKAMSPDLGLVDTASSTDAYSLRQLAANFVTNAANSTYDYNKWAVVSGIADGSGNLNCDPNVQTFMVQLSNGGGQIPEPSTYAMMGAGLLGLAFLSRRTKA
ncbi:MAG: PEP-CTERM sorting domain-containing protein [Acidobacteria bacterium]|nr:PEP-CTERM sorting domain-containing protein [Acidobacteriota bacterium]